ncbi:hypothetical protein TRVA0_003S03796 [Trichomonascus vanleenenianus]|uniref:uncharacterized protein n=1 Tax=Trichomonascus vanleenenianus TaxID=2268995 RepID=UPI003ECB6841
MIEEEAVARLGRLVGHWKSSDRYQAVDFTRYFDLEGSMFAAALSLAAAWISETTSSICSTLFLGVLQHSAMIAREYGVGDLHPFHGAGMAIVSTAECDLVVQGTRLALSWAEAIGITMFLISSLNNVDDVIEITEPVLCIPRVLVHLIADAQCEVGIENHQALGKRHKALRRLAKSGYFESRHLEISRSALEQSSYQLKHTIPRMLEILAEKDYSLVRSSIERVDLFLECVVSPHAFHAVPPQGDPRLEERSVPNSLPYGTLNSFSFERDLTLVLWDPVVKIKVIKHLTEAPELKPLVIPRKNRCVSPAPMDMSITSSFDSLSLSERLDNDDESRTPGSSLGRAWRSSSIQSSGSFASTISSSFCLLDCFWYLNRIPWLRERSIDHTAAYFPASGSTGFVICSYLLYGRNDPGEVRALMGQWIKNNATLVKKHFDISNYHGGSIDRIVRGTMAKDWFRMEIHGRIFAEIAGCECLMFPVCAREPIESISPLGGHRAYTGMVAFLNDHGRLGLIFAGAVSGEEDALLKKRFTREELLDAIEESRPISSPRRYSVHKFHDVPEILKRPF